MKKSNRRISDLFYDNRFLLVFSIICAVLIWLVVAVEFGDEIEYTCKYNVKAGQSAEGLVPFGEKEFEVSVIIKGKKYIVESAETKENIEVVLNTSHANSAGKDAVLNVEVKPKESRPLYEIVDYYPKTVSAFYDYEKEKPLKIETQISYDSGKAAAVNYKDFDVEFINEYAVTVSGPSSEIDSIESVVAKASLKGDFRETQTFTADLVLVGKNGASVNYCETNLKSVQLRLPVYRIADLKPVCVFSNPPADYIDNLPLEYTVTPGHVSVAMPESQLEGRDSFELATKIDFSQLHQGVNEIKIPAVSSEISGGRLLDTTSENFIVTVNVPGMSQKAVSVPENVSINIPENLSLELIGVDFESVVIVGPGDELSAINKDNLVFTADFSEIDASEKGTVVTVPVKLFDKKCWVYGTYNASFVVQ